MNSLNNHISCITCNGQGKLKGKISAKAKKAYQEALEKYHQALTDEMPKKPIASDIVCSKCKGSGLVVSQNAATINKEHFPKVAIIGAGIGGMTLAVACYQRGIPFTIYERDKDFNARSQGYGLTLQQASKALKALGITVLEKGIVSTKHIVHDTKGKVIGEWGMRTWVKDNENLNRKKTNIHIARQALRAAIYNQLGEQVTVKWGYELLHYQKLEQEQIAVTFKTGNDTVTEQYDMLVGADGIRSTVRNLLIPEEKSPLRFLNCMVILGICSLECLASLDSPLLDGATVFQTANGIDRIYMMPFDNENVMWQLSFPISEEEAKQYHHLGADKLKAVALSKTKWHSPIPEIVHHTPAHLISGYPVYDRTLLEDSYFDRAGNVTLIGDAAHPMSPFKGQGANQAILDAIALARQITKGCRTPLWKIQGLRSTVLHPFEHEMIARSAVKVNGSAEAAAVLHTEKVLQTGNKTRGSLL